MPTPAPKPYQLIGPSEDGQAKNLLADLNEVEGRQRLQAIVAEWLRMENLVVLTAAGCSTSQGGKLMAGLESTVLELIYHAKGASKDAKEFIAKRTSAVAARKGQPPGFEDWLSYLVNAHFLATETDSPFKELVWKEDPKLTIADLSWLISTLGKAIFAECALTAPHDHNKNVAHLAFLAKLMARDSALGRAHLFTLNYDTLFEQSMEALGVQYFDGFTGRADSRFDPAVYGLDIYYPGEIAEGRVRRFDKFLHFYKLHGSIHWYSDAGEIRSRHPDLSKLASYCALSQAEKVKFLEDPRNDVRPAGILPTANKFSQTLAMPYSHLFRSFQIRLSAPQTFLLVMGYGFGDQHITKVIETALMNPSLIMLVVEPDPNSSTIERIRRYKELGRRAFVLTATEERFHAKNFEVATFQDFARNVMPDVRWLDDFLRLRRFEKQIHSSRDDDSAVIAS